MKSLFQYGTIQVQAGKDLHNQGHKKTGPLARSHVNPSTAMIYAPKGTDKTMIHETTIKSKGTGMSQDDLVAQIVQFEPKDQSFILNTLAERYPKQVAALREAWRKQNSGVTEIQYVTEHIRKGVETAHATVGSVFERMSSSVCSQRILSGQGTVNFVRTGFRFMDQVMGNGKGIAEGVTLIGGRSSLGKTAFALQMAIQMARAGAQVLYISLEMTEANITARKLSYMSEQMTSIADAMTTQEILTCMTDEDFDPETVKRLAETAKYCDDYICGGLYVADQTTLKGATIEAIDQWIANFVEYTKAQGKGQPVIFVDYLQYIVAASGASDLQERQVVTQAMTVLNQSARKYKMPIIVLSSLNRASYNSKMTEMAFKESGSVEYFAENLIGLQYKGVGESDFDVAEAMAASPREIQAVCLKNRLGSGAGVSFNFNFFPRANRWNEINYTRG